MEQTGVAGEQQIDTKVRTFIKENFFLGAESGEFGPQDSFLEQGIIDSTGVLELVNFIEDAFSISVEDEELIPENLDTLERVTRYIERKIKYARQ